ncbi:MAG: 50S ribosomal protein L10 [Candidatus Margulisiibacteriota bacterium]
MPVIRQEKIDVIEKVKEKVQSSSIVVFARYSGVSVSDMTSFRSQLRKQGAHALVCKNTLAKIALHQLNYQQCDDMFNGPSILVNSSEDPVRTAKIVVDFAEQSGGTLSVHGAIVEQNVIGEADLKALSKLPSKEVLIAKAIGSIKSPITGLVRSLNSPILGFIYTLNAIKNNKE